MDVDDVLFPLVPSLTGYVNTRLGVDLAPEDYHTYDFCRVWGIPRDDAVDLAESYLACHSLDILPLTGAGPVVAAIHADFDLIVVTSREEKFRRRTERWLERHFPGVFSDVVMTGNRYRGRHCLSKGEACIRAGADCLVDDQPEHVVSAQQQGISTVLFGCYPWQSDGAVVAHHALDWESVPTALSQSLATLTT